MTEQAVLKETVVPEVTQEERVCRLAQSRDISQEPLIAIAYSIPNRAAGRQRHA